MVLMIFIFPEYAGQQKGATSLIFLINPTAKYTPDSAENSRGPFLKLKN